MTPLRWLKANGVNTAPLTGQDTRALLAIAATWELYAASDGDGSRASLLAVRALLGAMQPQCRALTKKLIARALDWSDVDPLWHAVTHCARCGCLVEHCPCLGGPTMRQVSR